MSSSSSPAPMPTPCQACVRTWPAALPAPRSTRACARWLPQSAATDAYASCVPRVQRSASVTWEGNVARGSGAISAATGAFSELPYSLASRVERPDGKTSPEELLAAAHAACFAMSLAGELAGAGTPVEHLDVHATITLDQVEDGSHRI